MRCEPSCRPALLGLLVHRFTRRFAWPRPFRLGFLFLHALAATTYSVVWLLAAAASELLLHGSAIASTHRAMVPFLVLGVWLYAMVAGVSYAAQATDRAVIAEASAARAGLAALRAQLHPHFLFNALHTVVQLIPREPARAALAAELVAGLLRTTLDEDRDLVTLEEELAFVGRYLDIERIRFGERLQVEIDVDAETRRSLVPSFSLQTLVENAIQHGAAPNIDATTIRISASMRSRVLAVHVADDGIGSGDHQDASRKTEGQGSGLQRLRERLGVLYGSRARLTSAAGANGGYKASFEIRAPAQDSAA